MKDNKIKYTKASIQDAEELLEVQKKAFTKVAEFYNDFSIRPLIETIDEYKNEFNKFNYIKAELNDKIIASARGFEKENTCYIGRVVVVPEFQNQGIGKSLMKEIEFAFQAVNRYELFTGKNNFKTLKFYYDQGYKDFKSEFENENIELIYLEKLNKQK